MSFLQNTDPQIADLVHREFDRQRKGLEMIASENFTSPAVMEAVGSVLTNKYAEGYPGRRYYGGCEFVDEVERLARRRACELFGAAHANVQPHSGSTANQTAFLALLEPGDRILGLSLSHGGHLTHGHAVNFSGMLFEAHHYEVDRETEQIDYDALAAQARELRPKLLIAGSSAYPRAWDFERMGAIAKELEIPLLVDMAHFAGLVAAKLHPDPVPHANVITTTTHKTLRGPRGGLILADDDHFKKINKINFPGMQGGPFMHVIAGKAVAFHEAMSEKFRADQAQTVANARALGEFLVERGLRLVSGGTDTHLVLVDLRPKGLTGKQAEAVLEEVGITVNKNTIPFDPESPFVTSGIRVGTPALTTRGMKEDQMREIAAVMGDALEAGEESDALPGLRKRIEELADAFPLYPELVGASL
ncbi:MAG TPA: serine hydroxymethyltransferase [Candidatus Krumholzibacteria bacterium]|nr:serine hydroxymethyltransferase [Candidatus Krumholzibacteria bacterium]